MTLIEIRFPASIVSNLTELKKEQFAVKTNHRLLESMLVYLKERIRVLCVLRISLQKKEEL